MTHNNFKWIVVNKLAGCHSPSVDELKEFKKLGINTVVCLQTCEPHDSMGDYDIPSYRISDLNKLNIELFTIPVEDETPPSAEQMDKFISIVEQPKRKVLVHCHSGIGRTGCILAIYIGYKHELNGDEAISMLRSIWQPYIATESQEKAVKNFLDWKPIPNACKTFELGKCSICDAIVKTACKRYMPLYSWREVSDYYTCPKCFDPCDYLGCPRCDPDGYKKALTEACICK